MPVLQSSYTPLEDGMTPLNRVLSRLEKVRKSGNGWSACCPAHEDHDPSLSVAEGVDGKVLIHCHKGCTFAEVMKALELPSGAAFTDGETPIPISPRAPKGAARRIAATYDYTDEKGDILFQTVRFDPKDFSQRHPDGRGGWIWNLNGTRRVLYRLPGLLSAGQGDVVYVVEGEKDVESLRALGLVATCNPLGAGKWRAEYNDVLRGRFVAILPDNDKRGHEHALEVAEALTGVASLVKIVELPDLSEKGDVSDWIACQVDAGHASGTTVVEVLSVLVANAPEWQTDPEEDRFPVHWAREALLPLPPVKWVIEDTFARGSLTALVGDAGTKKTWLLLDAAVCIAAGLPWLGLEVEQGTVLIIDEESGHNRLASRVHALMIGHGCERDIPLAWISGTGFDLRNRTDVDKMQRKIELLKPSFVVVDALMEVIAGADENSTQEVLPAIKTLRGITQDLEFAGAFIHHANREGRYRGSSAIKGVIDQMLMVTSQMDEPLVNVVSEKARDTEAVRFAARAHFIDLPQKRVWFDPAEIEIPTPLYGKTKSAILVAFGAGEQLTTRIIVGRVQSAMSDNPPSYGTVRNALRALERSGALRKPAGSRGMEATYAKA